MSKDVFASYEKLKSVANKGLNKKDVTEAIVSLLIECDKYISSEVVFENVLSEVEGKRYFVARSTKTGNRSRPINSNLYLLDFKAEQFVDFCSPNYSPIDVEFTNNFVYSAMMRYAIFSDTFKKDDKKTPGTVFEIFVGHIFANRFNIEPQKHIKIPTLEKEIEIPTDYVFNLGNGRNWLHLPIKLSTRERVIQVWAHQRLLDGMHGVNRFKGILVCMAETNMTKKNSVVEVALPKQWSAYQMYIAQLFRVYYLDTPEAYFLLKNEYPFIQIKKFGDLFREIDLLSNSNQL